MTEQKAVYKVKPVKEHYAPSTRGKYNLSRRKMWQLYKHLMASRDRLIELRDEARKYKQLDDVGTLSDAIYHVARTRAWLRHLCKRRFQCEMEDLKSYA